MPLLIKHATIVTARDLFTADLLIDGETIVRIEDKITTTSPSIIDAEGSYLIPGAVDAHVHMNFPFGNTVSSDDFRSGSLAALCGGTTCIIDFALPEIGESLHEAIRKRRLAGQSAAMIDFSLHAIVREVSPDLIKEIPELIESGVTSFKIFTTYEQEGLRLEPAEVLPLLIEVGKHNGVVDIHAEEPTIVNRATRWLLKAGKRDVRYHPLARPAIAESAMIAQLIELAREADCPIYFHHVSCKGSVDLISQAKARDQTVYAETCPQYLLLDQEVYKREDGLNFAVTPPLRTAADRKRLWKGLEEGTIDTVATDHCPFTTNQKLLGKEDFTQIPNGMPGIETRLALMYSEGVVRGRITLNRWIDLCCTMPAKIFGIYPKKGGIRVGGDADLVLFDPERKVELRAQDLHMNCDWQSYEGWELLGYPIMTIVKGRIAYEDGTLFADGHGQFIKGKVPC